MVVFSAVAANATQRELCLSLRKPDCRLSWPERWEFDCDCGSGWVGHDKLLGSTCSE